MADAALCYIGLTVHAKQEEKEKKLIFSRSHLVYYSTTDSNVVSFLAHTQSWWRNLKIAHALHARA